MAGRVRNHNITRKFGCTFVVACYMQYCVMMAVVILTVDYPIGSLYRLINHNMVMDITWWLLEYENNRFEDKSHKSHSASDKYPALWVFWLVGIQTFWFKEMHLKILSAKLRLFCLNGLSFENIMQKSFFFVLLPVISDNAPRINMGYKIFPF